MKILLVRTDRMGDLLMTLPAMRCVRQEMPEAEITWLVHEDQRDLVEGHPDADRILSWDPREGDSWRGAFRLSARLKPLRFDAAVVFNPTLLSHAALFLAGVPARIGYRRKWGRLLNRSIPDTKAARDLHEAEYNLELARLLGIPAAEPALRLHPLPEAEREAEGLLQMNSIAGKRPLVALHPWTSNPAKTWPLESFAELSKRLAGQGNGVLLIGEPPENAGSWKTGFSPEAADLSRRVPLRVLPALLRRCSLLISNDSGPVHVAAAVGTPTWVICRRGHERQIRRWHPLGGSHRILFDPTVDEALAGTGVPCGS